ncbi:MAG: hypothetical protein M1829_000816 [Trizodia sp. TS-e1964]|nr:MAG: hypothetical protein M1829_000816 [Trizodia sp. TS-e1964]
MTSPSIAFFGATGGCASATLYHSLQNGHHASALARTPEKLTAQLLARGLSQATLDAQLSIILGDVHDVDAVVRALTIGGRAVDVVVSGIGGTPKFTPNPLRPTLTDPSICADAMAALTSGLAQVASSHPGTKGPVVVAISSTGLSETRDVPLALVPVYHLMLKYPHEDKRAMEETLVAAASAAGEEGGIGGWVIVRPTLLTDGKGVGVQKVRAGTEGKPVLGWGIARVDVGEWIYEEVVRVGGGRWVGERVSLAY